MPTRRLRPSIVGALCALGLIAAAAPSSASAAAQPGAMMLTDGAQCTANFLYTAGGKTYLGYAAHCAGTGAATDTNGCTAASLPLGTRVDIDGATQPGTLAYSSWLTMQANGEQDDETCQYNDIALVELAPADAATAKASVPVFGGPNGVGGATPLDDVLTYGNSSLRQGIAALSPKNGKVVEVSPGGWSYTVYTLTPGIPGDSGSGFLTGTGKALGVLSTVAIAPLPLSNGVGSLEKELAYARAHGLPDLAVVNGGPFRTSLLGLT